MLRRAWPSLRVEQPQPADACRTLAGHPEAQPAFCVHRDSRERRAGRREGLPDQPRHHRCHLHPEPHQPATHRHVHERQRHLHSRRERVHLRAGAKPRTAPTPQAKRSDVPRRASHAWPGFPRVAGSVVSSRPRHRWPGWRALRLRHGAPIHRSSPLFARANPGQTSLPGRHRQGANLASRAAGRRRRKTDRRGQGGRAQDPAAQSGKTWRCATVGQARAARQLPRCAPPISGRAATCSSAGCEKNQAARTGVVGQSR